MKAAASHKGGGQNNIECPNGHGPIALIKEAEVATFRGIELKIETVSYKCGTCAIKIATVDQGGEIQKALSEAYRKEIGLLTGSEIINCRKSMGLTQQELANKINVGVASIRRWENGAIQTQSMDKLLRDTFKCEISCNNPMTGNRHLSLSRVKLVIREFEKWIKKELLTEGDRMLFTAKYLFYADMISFRKLGKSLTGATYAALPNGPQLNNYTDLIDSIIRSNESECEPLKSEEILIIKEIAKKYPNKWDVFNASHNEKVFKSSRIGSLIYYSEAHDITDI